MRHRILFIVGVVLLVIYLYMGAAFGASVNPLGT